MANNRRKYPRKAFSYNARIVASDGTWGHDCHIVDVSASGARLVTDEPIKLPGDFLLSLTKAGRAVRKCRLAWTRGKEIGVAFSVARTGRPRRESAPQTTADDKI